MHTDWPTLREFLGMSDEQLAAVDPVVMNLVIARGIPSLANLDIGRYVSLADEWGAQLLRFLPGADENFRRAPHQWKNDLDFSRLAYLCWFVGTKLRIAYREDQKYLQQIRYTDPNDLFLTGVMDTRRGTCGNMATLYVALAKRLGLPVSLACVGSHFIARFDDGSKQINIETSSIGLDGNLNSAGDEEFCDGYDLPKRAIDCGSDLRAVTAREMLGLFVGARARHIENLSNLKDAEPDYLLARYLFPNNRALYISQNQVSVQCSTDLFNPFEKGHPTELAEWLREVVQIAPWIRKEIEAIASKKPQKEYFHADDLKFLFSSIVVSGGGR